MKKLTNAEIRNHLVKLNKKNFDLMNRVDELENYCIELEKNQVRKEISKSIVDMINIASDFEDCKIKLKTVGPEVKGKQYLTEAVTMLSDLYMKEEASQEMSVKIEAFIQSFMCGEMKKWRDAV
jgi:hypothetical protein